MEDRTNIKNITEANFRSQLGYGNQLIACGILLRLGYEAMLAETGNSFYDLIIVLQDPTNNGCKPIKVGVRTLSKNLSFSVNSGGGINRPRPAGRGAQLPTIDQVQLWIGITKDFDLYFIPHSIIIGKTRLRNGVPKPIGSLSKGMINHTCNNTSILDNLFNQQWLQENVVSKIRGAIDWI